jgi:CHASE3 domain sensor protein
MDDINSGGTPRRFLPNVPIIAIFAGITLIAAAVFLALSITESREQRRIAGVWERHTFEVLLETRDLLVALQNVETGNRGYMLTSEPRYLGPFNQGMADVPRELAQLKSMTKENAEQQAKLDALSGVIDQRLARLQRGVDLVRAGNREAAIEMVKDGRGKALMDRARAILADINDTETALLKQRRSQNDMLLTRTDRLMVGLIVLIAAMIAYGLVAMVSATKAQARSSLLEAERAKAAQLQDANAAAVRAAAIVSAIGDATPDLIYAKDRSGRITYANPSTLAIIGKSLEDLLGLTTVEYNPDSEEAASVDANDARVMESGTNEITDEVFTAASGAT